MRPPILPQLILVQNTFTLLSYECAKKSVVGLHAFFFFFFLAAGRFHPMFTSFTGLQQPETFGWDSGLSSTTDNNAAECCLCQKASTSDNEDWYIIEQSLELQFLNLFHDI